MNEAPVDWARCGEEYLVVSFGRYFGHAIARYLAFLKLVGNFRPWNLFARLGQIRTAAQIGIEQILIVLGYEFRKWLLRHVPRHQLVIIFAARLTVID